MEAEKRVRQTDNLGFIRTNLSSSVHSLSGPLILDASENLFDSNAQTCHDVVRYSNRPGFFKMFGIMNFFVVPKTVL